MKKHTILLAVDQLKAALPATRSMSRSNLFEFLDRYGKVVVKPTHGWGGDGVMFVNDDGDEGYTVHYGKTKKRMSGRNETYAFLKRKIKKRPHIVQQKIDLARVDGKPFDIRVMIQRKRKAKWTVTGTLAKIAGRGYGITNVARSKGKVVTLATAVRKSNVQGTSIELIEQDIHRIALRTARKYQRYYRIDTVGLDIGLDPQGKVWIIEANFTPNPYLFAKLKDKMMFRRIMRYQKS